MHKLYNNKIYNYLLATIMVSFYALNIKIDAHELH